MSTRRAALARARRAAGLTQEALADALGVDRSTVQRWEQGRSDPHLWARQRLGGLLGLDVAGVDALLSTDTTAASTAVDVVTAGVVDDELDALELARRATVSDVSDATLSLLEHAVDDLASSYATTTPAVLLDRVRHHLGYAAALLDGRSSLRHHHRVVVTAAWLSLLAATLHVDIGQQSAATARLRTADSLAAEADHAEVRAWCRETSAWRALLDGDHREAVALSRAAQSLAPVGSSVRIQATAQEGRAWARLGDRRATTRIVSEVNALAESLPVPDRPEHHYRYDPRKATSYTATTLAWIGDPSASDYAQHAVDVLESDGARPRRLAVARLDLALALLGHGEIDGALDSAMRAVRSGSVMPSSRWRAVEIVQGAEDAGAREAVELRAALAAGR